MLPSLSIRRTVTIEIDFSTCTFPYMPGSKKIGFFLDVIINILRSVVVFKGLPDRCLSSSDLVFKYLLQIQGFSLQLQSFAFNLQCFAFNLQSFAFNLQK